MRLFIGLAAAAAVLLTGCSGTDDEAATGAPQTADEEEAPASGADPTEPPPSGDGRDPIDCVGFLPIAAEIIGGAAPAELANDAEPGFCEYEAEGVGSFSIRGLQAGETLPTPQDYAGDSAAEEIVEYPELGSGAFLVGNSNVLYIFTPTEMVVAVSFDDPLPDIESIGLDLVRAVQAYP